MRHGLSGTSRCCVCCDNGKCMQCTCVKAGRNCSNCLPSKRNRCSNKLQCASSSICDDALLLTGDSSDIVSLLSVEDEHFVRAFGTSLLHSKGALYSYFGASCGCGSLLIETHIIICRMDPLVVILLAFWLLK